jgi:MFS family permease
LSLLGVCFGLGALGMPLLLGSVSGAVGPFQVVAAVGWLTLAVGLYFAVIDLPPAKPRSDEPAGQWKSLFSPLLITIAFFLFCQSALEAIINNWTTTYVTARGVMSESNALYALSLHMVGMVVMRLLTGSLFRSVSQVTMMWACLVLLFIGVLLMQVGTSMAVVTAGLVLSGAGLAGGFPIMLGFVGDRFPSISGTAFSFVFAVALVGNMLVNYLTGVIVQHYGVGHLTTVSYAAAAVMAILFVFIVRKLHVTSMLQD